MNGVALIQARMTSSRLPGKVMADIAGHPALWHVVERVRRARQVQQTVVVTSTNSADDALAEYCSGNGIACFRGSEDDVLDRYYRAAQAYQADVVVRVTADCPLIDPDIIDRVVAKFREGGWDYVSNTAPYSYPAGLDVEVISFDALRCAWREADKPADREHVTPYIRFSEQFRPNRFRLANVEHHCDLSLHNWTIDNPADLEYVRAIYRHLGPTPDFGMSEILQLLDAQPELRALEGQPSVWEYTGTTPRGDEISLFPHPNPQGANDQQA